jgi:hypothetical protein
MGFVVEKVALWGDLCQAVRFSPDSYHSSNAAYSSVIRGRCIRAGTKALYLSTLYRDTFV